MNYKDLEELGYVYDEDMMAYEVEHGIWVHYNDSDERKAINFWIKELGLKRDDLGKISNMVPRGKGSYRNKKRF